MIAYEYVYSRIGMALISAQRVEFITGQLLEHLKEFDGNIYGITPTEFLENKGHNKKKKNLGDILRLLNLNSKLVIEEELNQYLIERNLLAHNFWSEFLHTKNEEQAKLAIEFCNKFGAFSEKLEFFFKGFIYFLSLKHVKDRDELNLTMKDLEPHFIYFMSSLENRRLK